ncbi:ribosomal protein L1 [Dacryopinax primogenitus]|uniref:Ribosomal protein L1 n=1 Tax=Dacryopinax primogenitus (strain DJM 731) TaxID=1858805 RepID=M5FUV6_DACPD|nr:ribosomal protein L1 [Dacryopinax primogenitus]EJU00039.1 ribosomal protein L1 [Dacryopinax primogenitus]
MSTSLLVRSLRPSTSYTSLCASSTPSRRCLHASTPAFASKKKKAKEINEQAMSIPDAVFLLKSVEVARPNNAIELTVNTDFTRGEAAMRGRLSFPRDPRTEDVNMLVFCDGPQVDQALAAGATWAGGEDLVEGVLNGKIQPTAVLATPSMAPTIARLARTLGPRGLMPNAKRGTLVTDVVQGIQEAKGMSSWKVDRSGAVRTKVARVHFTTEEIEKNIAVLLDNIKRGGNEKKASYETGRVYAIQQVYISSTQGPGIELRDYSI